MVLNDVDQATSPQANTHTYPLQSRPQLPSSTVTTEGSRDSTDGHESSLIPPSIGDGKVRPADAEAESQNLFFKAWCLVSILEIRQTSNVKALILDKRM